jgi:hypothetical protein
MARCRRVCSSQRLELSILTYITLELTRQSLKLARWAYSAESHPRRAAEAAWWTFDAVAK